jgi:hypothetical protein
MAALVESPAHGLLQTILSNIVAHPNDQKYCRINLAGKAGAKVI